MECPRGAKTRKPKLIRYILKTYCYISVAQAVILTVKRSLKDERKADNKEKENKRQENQKNEVINQQAAVNKCLPGVQARCAVFFL